MSIKDSLKKACGESPYLYNITFKTNDMRQIIDPYIPYSATEESGEDRTIPRVCLADSIEHCISAIGPADRDLHVGAYIVVRRVKRSYLDESMIVTPHELYNSGKVPDALENMEHWYKNRVYFERLVYRVVGFDYEHKINWTCIKVEQVHEILTKLGVDGLFSAVSSSSYDLYRTAAGILEKLGKYELSDALYDDIIELDWARGISVSNLQLELCEQEGIEVE